MDKTFTFYFAVFSEEKKDVVPLIFSKKDTLDVLLPTKTIYHVPDIYVSGGVIAHLFYEEKCSFNTQIKGERTLYKHEVEKIKKAMENAGWEFLVDMSK